MKVLTLVVCLGLWLGLARAQRPEPGPWELQGVVHAVLEAPDGKLYAGMLGGIVRSTDRGATWTRFGTGLPRYPFVNSMVLASDGSMYAFISHAVYRSTNQGATWRRCGGQPFPPKEGEYFNLVATPRGIYAHFDTRRGLFRSPDQCATWERVEAVAVSRFALAFAYSPDGVMYAGTNGKLFVSTDHGIRWTARQPNGIPGGVGQLSVAPDGEVYTIVRDSLYRSTDRGVTWTHLPYPPYPPKSTVLRVLATAEAVHVYNTTGQTAKGFLSSADRGATWSRGGRGLENCGLYTVVQTKDRALIAGCHIGIAKSSDGGATWQPTFTPRNPAWKW